MFDMDYVYDENRNVMEALATRLVFGKAVEDEELAVIQVARTVQRLQSQVASTELQAAVCLRLGVSRPTAASKIESVIDRKLLNRVTDTSRETRNLFFVPEEILIALKKLTSLKRNIAQVLEAQAENPSDPDAGRQFVPAEVFFDCRAQDVLDRFAKRLKEKIEDIKEARK